MKSKHDCIETLETRIAPAAAVFPLSGLDGNHGFTIVGAAAGDYAGESVSNAGDVNGDGFDDVIVAASSPDSFAGAAYVVFGKPGVFAASVDLAALDGTSGFKIKGVEPFSGSGIAVSAAGDVNGDGFADLLVGLRLANNQGGMSYVIFGKASGFTQTFDPATVNGINGFALPGASPGDLAGDSVSAAGDVNGDGFDDLILGAFRANPNGGETGAAYVVFGKAAFPSFVSLGSLNGVDGFRLTGFLNGDRAGRSVSGAVDINGDGFDDVIIGAPSTYGTSGGAYVVFGKETAFGANIDLGSLNGSNGFKLSGAAYAGISVSSAGDVNGDGFDDVVVGAHGVSSPTASQSGAAYVVFGKSTPFAAVLTLPALDGTNGFKMAGASVNERVGWSVSGAGDFNADGFDDLIIGGASPYPDKPGTSYLVYGKANGHAPLINLGDLSGGDGFQLIGATNGDNAGWEVSAAGDLNADGFDDVIIGATRADGKGRFTGAAHVVFGGAVEIRISDVFASEGNAGVSQLHFTVSLSEPARVPVTVNVGSENGTAIVGSDFNALALTTLTFAPGETSKTVTVDITGDMLFEADETFSVLLSEANGAVIRDGIGIGTISNDDVPPDVTISGGSVLEGHTGIGSLVFTISLSAPSGLPATVEYATSDGTAIAGEDYTAVQGLLTFAPGETTKTVAVSVSGDLEVEAHESFAIALSNASGAILDTEGATGTILNDDVTLLGKRKATYIDEDGDIVLIKVNKGTLKVEDFTLVPAGVGSRLALVDFSGDAEFSRANLSITAKSAPGAEKGKRSVDVGYIDASGIDLGKVVIKGDLGRINAGNELESKPGLMGLMVSSLGARGSETQLPGGSLVSEIAGKLKTVKIAGSMTGAQLSVSGDVKSVKVAGDLRDSSILSDGKIGSVQIGGDLVGTEATKSRITAQGKFAPGSAKQAIAISRLSVGGSVGHVQILAGYDRTGTAANADASIGSVKVGLDWIASDIAAGVVAGPDNFFGTNDDARLPGGNSIVARIASIQIGGTVPLSDNTDGSHYGFVAEEIAALKVAGDKVKLTRGAANDLSGLLVGAAKNLVIRELS